MKEPYLRISLRTFVLRCSNNGIGQDEEFVFEQVFAVIVTLSKGGCEHAYRLVLHGRIAI